MTSQVPVRITIELQPGSGSEPDWSARTLVDGGAAGERAIAGGQAVAVAEPREQRLAPEAYEPADCTCEDGWCDRDHANE